MAVTVYRGKKYIKNQPQFVTTIASDYSIKMFSDSGEDIGIGRSDFITSLSALGLGGTSSGSDTTIDCGDRMTGNESINMGQRV